MEDVLYAALAELQAALHLARVRRVQAPLLGGFSRGRYRAEVVRPRLPSGEGVAPRLRRYVEGVRVLISAGRERLQLSDHTPERLVRAGAEVLLEAHAANPKAVLEVVDGIRAHAAWIRGAVGRQEEGHPP